MSDRWSIIHGENLAVMRAMPPQSVHLVYGDAPFNTGRDFTLSDGRFAYSDKWPSLDAFVGHIRERCAAARDLLTDDGTLIVQVDPETSHYVKVALDGVFGRECFRNEIVWKYKRWPSPSRDFQWMHDTLLRYVRNAKAAWHWTQLHEPLSPWTLSIHGAKKQKHAPTENGRKWGAHAGNEETDSPGAYMSDVWEIPVIAPQSAERLYPTQKPEELVRRIVSACSYVGDTVLDPWCGSGTTVAVSGALGRRGTGIDQSPVAVEIARARIDGPLFASATPPNAYHEGAVQHGQTVAAAGEERL